MADGLFPMDLLCMGKPLALFSMANLRQTASQLVQQLGALEMRKSKLIAEVEASEKKAQALLSDAKARMGLGEDKPWQILEDGRIEIWHLPKPMDEMKAAMEAEIANIDNGLLELEEDIVVYEAKLKELNNPIINRIFDAR